VGGLAKSHLGEKQWRVFKGTAKISQKFSNQLRVNEGNLESHWEHRTKKGHEKDRKYVTLNLRLSCTSRSRKEGKEKWPDLVTISKKK